MFVTLATILMTAILLGGMLRREGQGTYSVEELQLLIVQSHQAGILEDIERRVRITQVAILPPPSSTSIDTAG